MQIPDAETNLTPIDASQLLQRLHDLDHEEGRRLIMQSTANLHDQAAFGVALADDEEQRRWSQAEDKGDRYVLRPVGGWPP